MDFGEIGVLGIFVGPAAYLTYFYSRKEEDRVSKHPGVVAPLVIAITSASALTSFLFCLFFIAHKLKVNFGMPFGPAVAPQLPNDLVAIGALAVISISVATIFEVIKKQ